MKHSAFVIVASLAASLWGASGCVAPEVAEKASRPDVSQQEAEARLDTARKAFAAGDCQAALLICAELSYTKPGTPGLLPFRAQVLKTLRDQEALNVHASKAVDRRRMTMEALEATRLPGSYGRQGTTEALPEDRLSLESPMRKQLDMVLNLHLRDVTLSGFIEALSDNLGVRMIADQTLGADKRMTIEGKGLPLREVLAYASRNLGVEFHLGDQVIWVTAADAGEMPLESRIYRLRQGIQMNATDWEPKPEEAKKSTSDIGLLTHKATVPSKEPTSIERILTTMVPEQPGSAMHFDRGTHTLFVRNSRKNLELIESIVQALDSTPPQILIEARFIEVVVDDLRELGIEWLLGSPWSVESKQVEVDGVMTEADKIVVSEAGTRYSPYDVGEGGSHPLGPQGAFGLIGSPATAAQGLNVTLEGILTDPLFEAVLHALEISGKGRTLSMPRVTTMNNNPAKLRSGSDLRFFEEFQAQAFSLVDANNQKYTVTALIPKGTPSIEELGITLVAVPSVGADRQGITLLLNPSISSLEGFVSYQDDSIAPIADHDKALIRQVVVKLPVFTRREVATKLTVQSGETVVMGGLIDSIEQDTVHKIPILGDIPVLGALFRRSAVTEQRRNLLIFVTATVISDRGESLLSPLSDPTLANRLP
jgi:type IV pilus assembly protein PilQ